MKNKILLTIMVLACYSISYASDNRTDLVSIHTPDNGLPFSELKKKIEKQTGYQVIAPPGFDKLSIIGEYTDIEVDKLLLRLFKDENITIISDSGNKVIQLETLGTKQFPNQFSSAIDNSSHSSDNNAGDDIDPVTGLTFEELKNKIQNQKATGRAKYEDQGIDPVTGLQIKELESKIKNQKAIYKAKYEDQGIDPVSGLTFQELKNRIENQKATGRAKYEDQGIDPVSGLTFQELKSKIH